MRFRFTIRDLLWLTLVVALATGWWLDHRRHIGSIEPFKFSQYLILDQGSREKSADRLSTD